MIEVSNNKRIAHNTLFLYFRMILTMAISLYTSRVVLNTLGIEDYGIYNVVGGVITILSFITNSLSGAGSRFITFSLGKGNNEELRKIFSIILFIHIILSIIILILGETIGLWFVRNKLVIQDSRISAALWVYQCSIFTTIVGILSAPYNSLIISYEKMSVFAYISIIEVILKLGIVYLLYLSSSDKLVLYAVLILCVQLFIRIIYTKYSSKHFVESNVRPSWDFNLFKEIGSYAFWTMNGNMAIIGYTQGVNILLNMFFGPVVNAARGIAVQVQNAVMTFVQNFLTAINPQIIKSCAAQDYDYMHRLVIAASKYGFFMMMMLAFPLFIMIEPILKIWLGVVPNFTAAFVRIMLYAGLLNPLCRTLVTAINATGNLKKFQLYEGTSLLMVVPISYILLKKFNISPESVMWVYIIVEIITQFIRVIIVLPAIHMSYSRYLKNAILPLLTPTVLFITVVNAVKISPTINICEVIFYSCLSCIFIALVIFLFGLNKNERLLFKSYINKCIENKIK